MGGGALLNKRKRAAPYDPAPERLAFQQILAQAQWLYEQHERRVEGCQTRAVAVMTIAASVVALLPSRLSASPSLWQLLTLVFTALMGLGTILLCLRVLAPRKRVNGLPAIPPLRRFALKQDSCPEKNPQAATQFAFDMLNPTRLDEPAPVSTAAADAARRTDILAWAYRGLATTFVLAIAQTTLSAFIP